MTAPNNVIPVDFASENIRTYAVENVQDFPIENRSIIVNMGNEPIYYNEEPQRGLLPRKSTILKNKKIVRVLKKIRNKRINTVD